MFNIVEKRNEIVIEINGKPMCFYCPTYGLRELKMKIKDLLERGFTEL